MFDLVVIGSGPGGYVAAIRASQLGMNTAVIERSELGGICLNWGCIPTKALLKSVQALHYAQHSADYGFAIEGEIKPDLAKIVERSRGVSANMSRGIEYLFKKNKITVIQGSGKLAGEGKIDVTAADGSVTSVEAKNIIIATGARANSLPFAPIDGKKIISYRQALVPDALPKSLAVIGSGAIGSELAYFYRSLGTEVHLIEYLDAIVPLEDEEVSAQLSRSFRKMGMKVMVSSQVKNVDTSGELCKLTVQTKKGEEIIETEKVLSAVGVVANIENLGLEELGIAAERGKIKVDAKYMTTVKGIYAIGDVIATPALAHVASAEGINCVEQIAGLNPHPVNYSNIPGCTYTTPEIGSVGITEKAAKERGIEYKVGKFPFTASGKAAAAGDKDGFVKLIVDANSDEILGAHLIGANVTEMVSGIVVARNLGVKARDFIHSVHPHPTMSEAIMEAAAAAHGEVIHI
ncbi:MAG: dihydrolipoyl dehydrogenase [Bacteroidetes bacterium HGW-Bacteroidetes-14]|jgi:dihydrolipoamide dehydrogenase|nr:MAG: dihydrolipoyl dehydrogenase [Bacteroidetes bacterium HGW-Bacteroidetes-14]